MAIFNSYVKLPEGIYVVTISMTIGPLASLFYPSDRRRSLRRLNLPRVKELCIRRHFGGFVLHEGYAYFRLSSPEAIFDGNLLEIL